MTTTNTSSKKFCIFCLSLLLLLLFVAFSPLDVNAASLTDYTFLDSVVINQDVQFLVPLPEVYNTNTSPSLRLVFDANLDSTSSWMVAPFASYNGSTDRGVFFLVNPSTGSYSCQFGSSWIEGKAAALGGTRHSFDVNFAYGNQSLFVDGNTDSPYAHYTFKPTYSYSIDYISLFKREITGGSGTRCPLRGTVYSVDVLLNGNHVYSFRPAQRNSDQVVGLYDYVSGQFFVPNEGVFLPGNALDSIYPGNSDSGIVQPTLDDSLLGTFGFFMSGIVNMLEVTTVPILNVSFLALFIGMFLISSMIALIQHFMDRGDSN